MDLSFCYSLLTDGFKVGDASDVTLVKRIKYHNNEVEAAWPLGAAINLPTAAALKRWHRGTRVQNRGPQWCGFAPFDPCR